MNVYIDFSNFCSYLLSMSNPDFEECNDLLLNNCQLNFTFDKSEIFNAPKDVQKCFDLWIRLATKSRNGNKNDWNIQFPPRPISETTHNSFTQEQLFSMYMIDDSGLSNWSNFGCLLVAPKGKEIEIIKNLRIAGAFNPTKQFRIRSMSDWSDFGNNSSPCTDIIIVDQYLFAQSDLEYEVNAYSLVEQLCKWANDFKINIIIFTLKDYKDGSSYTSIPFFSIIRNLKNKLTSTIGCAPNITFVFLPGQEQHDRTIFTNYKLYTSGDSFKYFKDGVNISLCTHGEWMYISSLYDSDNLKNAKEFVSDLQNVIDKVKGGLLSIYGDKKSLFLNLN